MSDVKFKAIIYYINFFYIDLLHWFYTFRCIILKNWKMRKKIFPLRLVFLCILLNNLLIVCKLLLLYWLRFLKFWLIILLILDFWFILLLCFLISLLLSICANLYLRLLLFLLFFISFLIKFFFRLPWFSFLGILLILFFWHLIL